MKTVDYYYVNYFGKKTFYLILFQAGKFIQYASTLNLHNCAFTRDGKAFSFDCELTESEALSK